MTKHNQEILNCLNDYQKLKDPDYAVLLKGHGDVVRHFSSKTG